MKTRLLLFLNLIIVFLIFQFIEHAMTVSPGRTSGNGNPAILLILPLIILFFLLVFQWIRYVIRWITTSMRFTVVTIVVISHWIIAFLFQRKSFSKYKEVIAEAYNVKYGYIDWEYIDSITTGLTIHVNNQYFNLNTYLMLVSLSFMLASVITLIMKKVKKR